MPVNCPACGADVMVTGFRLEGMRSETWMRFVGGPIKIATTTGALEVAKCVECGAVLPQRPIDLLRTA